MKSIVQLLIVVATFSSPACAQHKEITDNWKTISISDKELGQVNYHVYKNKIDSHKPLIVYLQGSGNFPLYWLNPNGKYSTSTTLDFKSISNAYHIVLISKPNTPFVDRIEIAASGRKQYPVNDEYREKYSLDWRVDSADKVIVDALQELDVDSTRVIVWGHSEGSQVAPAVAVKNKEVTHVVSMMGNSLNHLYDFILMERMAALNGEKSNEEAQKNIESLYAEFEKIYEDPKSTTKEWFGETYYKWSSFTLTSPLENMLQLDIPILYIAGGTDRHCILNMDYANLEFMRKGKDNLTYKVFPNCDHYFMEATSDESGKTEWKDHLDEVNEFVLEWVNNH